MCERCGEVMQAYNMAVGPHFVCPECGQMGSHVINTPYCSITMRPNLYPCDKCAYIDITERDEEQEIPGRCLSKHHRIMSEEGPCMDFTPWNGEKRKTLERGVDVWAISGNIKLKNEKKAIKTASLKKSTLDYWVGLA